MNARERFLLIAAVVLLGAVVWKFVIHDPQQAAHASLVEARDAAQAELARNERILAQADKVRAEYDRLRAFIAIVEAKLPTRKEIPALLTAMERFTKRLGMGFENIHPSALEAVGTGGTAAQPGTNSSSKPGPASGGAASKEAAKALPYSRMEVNLAVTGTFAQVVQYLRELRDFPRLIIVNSVSLSPQTLPKLGVTLVTEIYTLGTPAEASAAGQAGTPATPPASPSGTPARPPAASPPSAPAAGPSGSPAGPSAPAVAPSGAPGTPAPAVPPSGAPGTPATGGGGVRP